MPTSLAEIQHELATWVLGEEAPALERHVALPSDVDPWERLAVYQGGYPARVREALEQCYPATNRILGSGSFASLARRYLPFAPHGWCNLNSIGRNLPTLLSDDPGDPGDLLTTELPFLPDLARLEWAVYRAFHATLDPPCDLAVCEDWSIEQWSAVRFEIRSDVAVVTSAWPIRDLWAVRDTPREEIDVALVDRPQTVAVARSGFDVEVRVLEESESTVARSLLRGDRLGEAMQELARTGADERAASALLSRWAGQGWITALLC